MSQAPQAIATSSNSQDVNDFETAIAACGIGCFNVCLMIASLFTATAAIFTTSTLSYIMPKIAECDFKLDVMDEGYLYAMSFAGMITSAIPWGFIADTMGRKIVLSWALILNGIVVMCSGLSQTYLQLLIFKFFDGFLISGPTAVVMSYISEFHGNKYRASALMIVGANFAIAALVLPILALGILPHIFILKISNFQIHTWHVFLLITSVVPFLGGIFYIFLPESPLFLMAHGRNQEALKCLQTIYAMNSRKPKSDYPITNLLEEDPGNTQKHLMQKDVEQKARNNTMAEKLHHAKEHFIGGLHQLRPMFSKPYFKRSLHVYSIYFCIFVSLNTIRLWLPTIFFTFMETTVTDICTVFELNIKNNLKFVDCGKIHPEGSAYMEDLVVAFSSFLFYFINIFAVNKVDSNVILRICLCLALFSGILMYFANSSYVVLLSASIYVSVLCVAGSMVIYASVNLFPTQMRTMVIILMMTFGRCGSFFGNLLFPFFISLGCRPPFLLIGTVITVGFVLSLFLPSTKNLALK